MTARIAWMPADLAAYIDEHSTAPDTVQQQLIEQTAKLGGVSVMQIGPNQGAFLEVLIGSLAPSLCVEIGTFTGYSSLAIARALGPEGRLICCDISEEWTAVAREHWDAAGVSDKIDLRIAPAIDTLKTLGDTAVDFAFIDADKGSYVDYYEALVPLLSDRGVIAVDNTLWDAQVIDAEDTSVDTEALRAFNAHVVADERTICALTPIGDGLTMIRLK